MQRADARSPTSCPRSQIHSVLEKPTLRLEACANARPGASTTPTSTVPERLAPDSSGPNQCSGTSPIKRMKPAPALASAAAASPARSGAGALTTVSAPSSGEKGRSVHGSKPELGSITIACANSRVAPASSRRASVSLPQVPFPLKTVSRPSGSPPIPVKRSIGVRLGQGCGGGSSAALVSAWLPKRTRIELIAALGWCDSCIFWGRLIKEKTQGEKWRHADHIEQMFVSQGLSSLYVEGRRGRRRGHRSAVACRLVPALAA